jgi:hypothetical protein
MKRAVGDRIRSDHSNSIEELQEYIARDRARLDQAIRCDNDETSRQAADLARDQQLLARRSWISVLRL